MLTDREIEAAYARMRDRIDLVNAEYLKAVARQINAIGGLNASSIRKLAQMRIYRANVVKIKAALAKALNLSVQELQELLERAAREVYADADYMAVIRGRRLMQLEYNEPLKKYISAVSAQTEERFHNYSNTTCIDENYQEAVTNAIDAVARGVTDYRSAIRDTMRKLGGDGLRITYESGVTRRMDTALRQNVLDGVKQIQQEAQRLIGEEIGATGVELSAHPFSAVDHEPAQGRQFSLQEFSRMQAGQPFTDANGNRYDGFKRPIGEWNCRHFASYIILGVSPRRYTDAQLKAWKEMNHKGCTIGGKHYTVYEASQLMRQLETSVRRQKDIANLAKLSGDDKLRREAQAKIVNLKAQYKAVSEASGLKQRAERMVVEGYGRKNSKLLQEQSPRPKKDGDYSVDWSAIQSDEYSHKFDKLSATEKANEAVKTRAKWALNNRDGVKTEEIYAIDMRDGSEISRITDQHYEQGVIRTAQFDRSLKAAENSGAEIMLIHNHPAGSPPSISDFNALLSTPRAQGITVGHDGSVYRYTAPNKNIPSFDFDVAYRKNMVYTGITAYERALEELSLVYGFTFEKL